MALKDLVPMPPAVPINRYLWSKIAELDPDLVIDYEGILPFFPLGETAAGDSPWDGKPSVVYDRMMVINPNPFYPIKKEQIHYALKADPTDSLVWGSAFQYILDEMDDVAKEINAYSAWKDYGIFFHNVRLFQTSTQVSSSGAQRNYATSQFYVTKFIIDTTYHYNDRMAQKLMV
ncbi:MAG: hypothetical protein VW551_04905 [Euryarchaeota archaeon]|jgi:hypothetical protein